MSAKKSTKKAVKKEIIGKSIGQNVILIIEGKKFSKRFIAKKDRESILKEVELYNKRNSLKREKEIIELMLSGKTTEKQRKKAVTKTVIKKTEKPKAATKKATQAEIDAAIKLVQSDGYTVSKNAPNVAPKRTNNREY